MEMTFSPESEAFREDVRAFLRDQLPADIRQAVALERMDLPREMQQRWHRILHKQGWSCPHWPETYGGPGWSDEQHYIFEREIALADAPRPMPYGVVMLGPTLIAHGTAEQKKRFLPDILSGEVFWCQGFSEPNAGSDLAALQCKAERQSGGKEDDHYLVNGTKIWTSEAHIADWIFGLFRSDSSGRKQQGITFLLIDLKSEGVSIQPLVNFDGSHEVNQVFFDNVKVPVENRLGAENEGWALAKYLLGLERFGTAEVSRSLASLGRLKHLAKEILVAGRPLIEDPVFAAEIAKAEIELRAVEVTELRFLFAPGGADALGAEASILKVRGTEVQQRILELYHETLGHHTAADFSQALDAGEDSAPSGPTAALAAARAHFNFRKTSIYAGSNEIQKTIVAKAVLGL